MKLSDFNKQHMMNQTYQKGSQQNQSSTQTQTSNSSNPYQQYGHRNENYNESQKNNSKSNSNPNYEQIYNSYQNMSHSELMNQLIGKVNEEKKNGTFNLSSIENSIKSVMPFLSQEQQQNLITLLNKIK